MPEQDPYASIAKPLNDDPYATIAKPVSAAKPSAVATPPSMLQRGIAGLGDVMQGVGKGAMNTLSPVLGGVAYGVQRASKALGVPPELLGTVAGSASEATGMVRKEAEPTNTAQKIGYGGEQAAEFLAPGGAEEKLAQYAPRLIRPLARVGMSALSSGAINKAQGGDFGTGAAMGAGGQVIGQGLKAIAPTIAETALKVRGNQRLFGRTVGDAILNDTSGVRPETVGRSAQAKIAELSPELDVADQASATSGKRGTLGPARASVADTIAGHANNRAMKTAGGIQPISDFLTRDQLTGLPLAEQQSAPGLRALKRGLNEDYIHNWTQDQPPAQKGAARRAYGEINEQLHGISPETEGIDQRISSLIPVSLQGQRVAAGAPITQRVLGRFGAHSGALAGGLAGGMEGRREGGVPGMLAGGALGVLAPELIASPEGQMIAARTLNNAGGMRPIVGSALQLDRKREK